MHAATCPPALYSAKRIYCPERRCTWTRRTWWRALARYRRHWFKRHAERPVSHPDIIPWIDDAT